MLGSGAALLGGALPWVAVTLRDGGAVEVPGSAAAPAVSGLALTGLALAGALTLTPTVVRLVLGVLQLVLGGLLAALSLPTVLDPAGRSVSTVSGITGVAGEASVRELVASAAPTPWPVFTLAAGMLAALAGLSVLLTARRWPTPGARYNAKRAEASQRGPADDWDSLSQGADPTAGSAMDPGAAEPGDDEAGRDGSGPGGSSR